MHPMVIPEGLEPPTYRLGICRSILMSYGTTHDICRNLRANARCSATPHSIGIHHAMSAWAKAGGAGSILTGKEHAGAELHPLARRAVQPPIDAKPMVAAIAYLPGQNHPAQHRIIKGVMEIIISVMSAVILAVMSLPRHARWPPLPFRSARACAPHPRHSHRNGHSAGSRDGRGSAPPPGLLQPHWLQHAMHAARRSLWQRHHNLPAPHAEYAAAPPILKSENGCREDADGWHPAPTSHQPAPPVPPREAPRHHHQQGGMSPPGKARRRRSRPTSSMAA